jgi:predicted negative regulator of RcsB-dependent stress response
MIGKVLGDLLGAVIGWRWVLLGAVLALLALYGWHVMDKRAAVAAATESLITQAEHDALKAVLEEERRLRKASDRAAQAAKSLAAAAVRREQASAAEISRLLGDAANEKGLTYPGAEDLQWLGTH